LAWNEPKTRGVGLTPGKGQKRQCKEGEKRVVQKSAREWVNVLIDTGRFLRIPGPREEREGGGRGVQS